MPRRPCAVRKPRPVEQLPYVASRQYSRSKVGRRRGTVRTVLFRRPPSARRVQVSKHTALQSTSSWAGQPPASRLLPCSPAAYLLPFALRVACPRSSVGRHSDDDYGSSMAVGWSRRPARYWLTPALFQPPLPKPGMSL